MKPYYERGGIQIYHADWRDVVPHLNPGEIDAVVTDPPYGFGLDTWDQAPDMDAFFLAVERLEPAFVSTFCQMPFLLTVAQAAKERKWHYCEHISWIKRNTTPSARLSRSHESVLIYAPKKTRKFHKTRGPYEDVRVPGVLVDIVSLTAIHRTVGFYRQQARQGGQATESKRGDIATLDRFANGRPPKVNGAAEVNYTNVWSFMPPNNKDKSKDPSKLCHVSMKPVPICQRLIEMTSAHDGCTLDPFMGTGSTLVAAHLLGRRAIGVEVSEKYCEVAAKRLEQAVLQLEISA